MATPTLRISRAQLTKFLGNDHDAIRQFETLFSEVANPSTPAAATEPEIPIETAAYEALARIERLERAFQMLELAPAQILPSILDDHSTSETATAKVWIDKKTIYRKVVNFGSLPNSTTKTVAHGIASLGRIVHIYGITYDGTTYVTIPAPSCIESWAIELSANDSSVSVTTRQDRSLFSGYIVIEYTKS